MKKLVLLALLLCVLAVALAPALAMAVPGDVPLPEEPPLKGNQQGFVFARLVAGPFAGVIETPRWLPHPIPATAVENSPALQ